MRERIKKMQRWVRHQDFLDRERAERMQPIADGKLAKVRGELEGLIDAHGTRHPDPMFTVVEFTRHVPWGDGKPWLISAWSVITPDLPRVTELHLANYGERVGFDQEGAHLYTDAVRRDINGGIIGTITERERRLNIYDVDPSEGIVRNIAKSFS